MLSQGTVILLCNIPAYVCAVLAAWRKFNSGQYYEGTIFLLIVLDLLGTAYFMSQVLDPATATEANLFRLAGFTAFLIPLIYMFHAPAGGQAKINKTTISLFLLAGLLFVPASSIELSPAYAAHYHTQPMEDMGLSVFYRGVYILHIEWIAIVLALQALLALYQLRRAVRYVHAHGAHYSRVSRAVFVWDFNCGFVLAVFFFLPISFWQQPFMRWAFIILASVIIGVGCLLIFLGFDLNPVSDEDGKRTSIKEFVQENGELINALRTLLEDEKIYLERGIQAEMVISRLKTNYVYFDRVMNTQYGVSFPEYVHRARIRYAQDLLEKQSKRPAGSRPLTIDEMAARCGYEDTVTFIRLYKRIVGEDPAKQLVQIRPLYQERELSDRELSSDEHAHRAQV